VDGEKEQSCGLVSDGVHVFGAGVCSSNDVKEQDRVKEAGQTIKRY